jgi:hypothetical protein
VDALGRAPARIDVLGIEAGAAEGEELSAAVSRAIERAADCVRERLAALDLLAPASE